MISLGTRSQSWWPQILVTNLSCRLAWQAGITSCPLSFLCSFSSHNFLRACFLDPACLVNVLNNVTSGQAWIFFFFINWVLQVKHKNVVARATSEISICQTSIERLMQKILLISSSVKVYCQLSFLPWSIKMLWLEQ